MGIKLRNRSVNPGEGYYMNLLTYGNEYLNIKSGLKHFFITIFHQKKCNSTNIAKILEQRSPV